METSPKRVRAMFAGRVIADSTDTLLVWERPQHPAYYFPRSDCRTDLIVPTGRTQPWEGIGTARLGDLRPEGREARDAALMFPDVPRLADTVRLRWKPLDAWFEEDEQVYVHPRDPYTRIDVLASSRRVLVRIGDVTVAESTGPRMLFETGLPARYYLPMTDLRLDLLESSDTVTRCPYKGTAEYYSVRVGDTVYQDVAWVHRTPHAECGKIAGLVAFHDEKVDLAVAANTGVGAGHPGREW